MTDLKALSEAATQGEWAPHNMVHAEGRPMTPGEIGEYITNSVKMSDETRFLFVSGEDGGNHVDICHTGNGPRGPHNTALICALVNGYRAGTVIPTSKVEEWLPIETAPKDRRMVVLIGVTEGNGFTNGRAYTSDPYCCFWNGDGWSRWAHHWAPTHWMPLPQPPTEGAKPALRRYTEAEVEARVQAAVMAERDACADILKPAANSKDGLWAKRKAKLHAAIRARPKP